VRELRNVVERLMLLATEGEVTSATVSAALPSAPTSLSLSGANSGPLAERVENFEREAILAELKRSNYHITNAAKSLGLERSHLYKKAEQLGIDIQKQRREEE
jgi:two-component system nitrogen regulation response regulator NtrX